MAIEKQPLRCTGCNKIIGQLDHLNDGKFSIKCKCGVMNTIEAIPAPRNFVYNKPYQDRLGLVKK